MDMNEGILDKVWNGNASIKEVEEAMKWIATDEGRSHLEEMIDRDVESISEAKVDQWTKCIPEVKIREKFYGWLQHKPYHRARWFLVASIIIPIIILSGVCLFFANKSGFLVPTEYVDVVVKNGQKLQVALADGTIVNLNSGSHLHYPKHFPLFHRDVKLDGEGYFDVAKDKLSPFSIDLNGVKIKVTGTKFNVEAYKSDKTVNVMLDEGFVSIITKDKNYPMTHGEFAVYDRSTGNCSIGIPKDDYNPSSWQNNTLYFHLTKLSDILKEVERQRNIHFIVPDSSIMKFRFTLHSKNESVEQILNDIETVSNICFTKQQSQNEIYVVTKK
jgi:ferric-dicitrate binding protein FerR (iron transport regulator)